MTVWQVGMKLTMRRQVNNVNQCPISLQKVYSQGEKDYFEKIRQGKAYPKTLMMNLRMTKRLVWLIQEKTQNMCTLPWTQIQWKK